MELNKYTVFLYDYEDSDYFFQQVQAENEYEALIEGVCATILAWQHEDITREEALLIMHERGNEAGLMSEWNYSMAVLPGWIDHTPSYKLWDEHSIFQLISAAEKQKSMAEKAYENMNKLLEPVVGLGLVPPDGLQSLTASCKAAFDKATEDVAKLTERRDAIIAAAKAAKKEREENKTKEVVGDDAITKQRNLARK